MNNYISNLSAVTGHCLFSITFSLFFFSTIITLYNLCTYQVFLLILQSHLTDTTPASLRLFKLIPVRRNIITWLENHYFYFKGLFLWNIVFEDGLAPEDSPATYIIDATRCAFVFGIASVVSGLLSWLISWLWLDTAFLREASYVTFYLFIALSLIPYLGILIYYYRGHKSYKLAAAQRLNEGGYGPRRQEDKYAPNYSVISAIIFTSAVCLFLAYLVSQYWIEKSFSCLTHPIWIFIGAALCLCASFEVLFCAAAAIYAVREYYHSNFERCLALAGCLFVAALRGIPLAWLICSWFISNDITFIVSVYCCFIWLGFLQLWGYDEKNH